LRERFRGRDVVSILDFTSEELLYLFEVAREMEKYSKGGRMDILRDKVLALMFFEPSTRTIFSFQTAMYRLGGSTLVFSNPDATSMAKGENLADTIRVVDSYADGIVIRQDTIRVVDSYADGIVIRHRLEGAARYAAEIAESPVINAGDGTQHHPTQAMIDLYTIWRHKGSIDGLNICGRLEVRQGRHLLHIRHHEVQGREAIPGLARASQGQGGG